MWKYPVDIRGKEAHIGNISTRKETEMDIYVSNKIAHMKRMGLVSASSPGIGKHGGAAPDWLIQSQKEKDTKSR